MSEQHQRPKLSKAEAGRIGGQTTARRHGAAHFSAAGKKGFMVTVARHWGGDRAGYLKWLRARGWLQDLQRAFEASSETCIEIPPIPGLDDLDDEEDAP